MHTNFTYCFQVSAAHSYRMATTNGARDGTIQGTGVSMHHAKGITIPQYITTIEHFYDQYPKTMI